MGVALNDRLHPDQWLDVCVEPIRHELKLAVGRNERDRPVVVEPRQTHTLVELDVLQLDGLGLTTTSRLKQHLADTQATSYRLQQPTGAMC